MKNYKFLLFSFIVFIFVVHGSVLMAAGYMDELSIATRPDGKLTITARGWAASNIVNDPLVSIDIFLDKKLVLSGPVTPCDRPDVVSAMGRDDWLNSGWNLEGISSDVMPGKRYTVTALAHFASGAKSDLIYIKKEYVNELSSRHNSHAPLVIIISILFLLTLCGINFAMKGMECHPKKMRYVSILGSPVFLFLAVFLIIFSVRLLVIGHYGNPTPYWDDWDFEAANLFKPYEEGHLHLLDFLAPHNEHRMALARIVALASLKLNNDRWDVIWEMVFNATVLAAVIAGFVLLAIRWIPSNARSIMTAFVLLAFIPPLAWENSLGSFSYIPYYLTLLLTLVSIWLCVRYPAPTPFWWLGVGVAFLGLFNVAGGVFVPLALLLMYIIQCAFTGVVSVKRILSIAVMIIAVAVGFLLIKRIPQHDVLRPSGILEFVRAASHLGAWPASSNWLVIIMQAPMLALMLLLCWRRAPEQHAIWIVCALGIWSWINIAATAFARGAVNETVITSRYIDGLALSLCLQFCALVILTVKCVKSRRWTTACFAFAAIWLVIAITGWVKYTSLLPEELSIKLNKSLIEEKNVKAYLATGDASNLYDKPFEHIPYPVAERLKGLLDDPVIRKILPTDLQPPNTTIKAETSAPLSTLAEWLLKNALTLLGLGGGLLLAHWLYCAFHNDRNQEKMIL